MPKINDPKAPANMPGVYLLLNREEFTATVHKAANLRQRYFDVKLHQPKSEFHVLLAGGDYSWDDFDRAKRQALAKIQAAGKYNLKNGVPKDDPINNLDRLDNIFNPE